MKIINKLLHRLRGHINIKKLQKRGLIVGRNVHFQPDCFIDPSHCWHIRIGDDVKIGAGARIYAHDASTKDDLGFTKVANTTIGNRVYIGANAMIMMGVTLGNDVIVGSGSIVYSDVPDNSLVSGNPAKVLGSKELYLMVEAAGKTPDNTFNASFTLRNKDLSNWQKEDMVKAAELYGKIYVE